MATAPGTGRVLACDHIKKLPDADRAVAMLAEVKRHAEPILTARGWRVNRLYEMCCCTSGGKNLSVGGFCVPAGDKKTSQRIALRLREPKSHVLYEFDHVMRVMIHELSHIVHGNHSASFYQLMEELGKDHASFLRRGVVLDESNMPVVGGRKLDGARHNPMGGSARSAAILAAEERAKKQRVMGSGRLGSGGAGGGGAPAGDWRRLTPGEMALRAAEARLQSWDASHGLAGDELEMGAAAARAEEEGRAEDECVEVVETARLTKQGSGNGGARGAGCGSGAVRGRSAGPGSSSASDAFLPSGRGAGRRKGGWVSVLPCAVCGPDCRDFDHRAEPPPPQDLDAGMPALGAEASAAAARRDGAAASGSTCGSVGGASFGGAAGAPAARARSAEPQAFVDLTVSSSDDESLARPRQLAPRRPEAPARGKGWNCKACTLLNADSLARCVACDTWRYASV